MAVPVTPSEKVIRASILADIERTHQAIAKAEWWIKKGGEFVAEFETTDPKTADYYRLVVEDETDRLAYFKAMLARRQAELERYI